MTDQSCDSELYKLVAEYESTRLVDGNEENLVQTKHITVYKSNSHNSFVFEDYQIMKITLLLGVKI